MAADDLYAVLGVVKDAQPEELKRAYRRLALQYHPDKNNGDPEASARFQKISVAYSTLSDPRKRKHYDEHGTTEDTDINPEEFIAMFHDLIRELMDGLSVKDLFEGMGSEELQDMPPFPFPKELFPPGTFPEGVEFNTEGLLGIPAALEEVLASGDIDLLESMVLEATTGGEGMECNRGSSGSSSSIYTTDSEAEVAVLSGLAEGRPSREGVSQPGGSRRPQPNSRAAPRQRSRSARLFPNEAFMADGLLGVMGETGLNLPSGQHFLTALAAELDAWGSDSPASSGSSSASESSDFELQRFVAPGCTSQAAQAAVTITENRASSALPPSAAPGQSAAGGRRPAPQGRSSRCMRSRSDPHLRRSSEPGDPAAHLRRRDTASGAHGGPNHVRSASGVGLAPAFGGGNGSGTAAGGALAADTAPDRERGTGNVAQPPRFLSDPGLPPMASPQRSSAQQASTASHSQGQSSLSGEGPSIGRPKGRRWLDAAKQGDVARMDAMLATCPFLLHYRGTGVGHTALHWCAAKGQAEALRLLLARGADPNALNSVGSTPLHAAACHGNVACIQVLMQHRDTKLHLRNDDAFTAADLAAQHCHMDAWSLISDAMRSISPALDDTSLAALFGPTAHSEARSSSSSQHLDSGRSAMPDALGRNMSACSHHSISSDDSAAEVAATVAPGKARAVSSANGMGGRGGRRVQMPAPVHQAEPGAAAQARQDAPHVVGNGVHVLGDAQCTEGADVVDKPAACSSSSSISSSRGAPAPLQAAEHRLWLEPCSLRQPLGCIKEDGTPPPSPGSTLVETALATPACIPSPPDTKNSWQLGVVAFHTLTDSGLEAESGSVTRSVHAPDDIDACLEGSCTSGSSGHSEVQCGMNGGSGFVEGPSDEVGGPGPQASACACEQGCTAPGHARAESNAMALGVSSAQIGHGMGSSSEGDSGTMHREEHVLEDVVGPPSNTSNRLRVAELERDSAAGGGRDASAALQPDEGAPAPAFCSPSGAADEEPDLSCAASAALPCPQAPDISSSLGRDWLEAARSGDVVLLTVLLQAHKWLLGYGGQGTRLGFCGNTALHWCAANGHAHAARFLLSAGADCDACNAGGATPLLSAVKNNKPVLMEILALEAGADINQADMLGDAPLNILALRDASEARLLELYCALHQLACAPEQGRSVHALRRALVAAGHASAVAAAREKTELLDLYHAVAAKYPRAGALRPAVGAFRRFCHWPVGAAVPSGVVALKGIGSGQETGACVDECFSGVEGGRDMCPGTCRHESVEDSCPSGDREEEGGACHEQKQQQQQQHSEELTSHSAAELARVRGNDAFASGHHSRAAAHYSMGIRLAPSDARLLSNRSAAYAAQGLWLEALGDAVRATELQPQWAKTHCRCGVALLALGRAEEAVAAYRKALEADPLSSVAALGLADAEAACFGTPTAAGC